MVCGTAFYRDGRIPFDGLKKKKKINPLTVNRSEYFLTKTYSNGVIPIPANTVFGRFSTRQKYVHFFLISNRFLFGNTRIFFEKSSLLCVRYVRKKNSILFEIFHVLVVTFSPIYSNN